MSAQVDEELPVRERVPDPVGPVQGERGLAHTRRPADNHEWRRGRLAGVGQHLIESFQLGVAPGEACGRRGELGWPDGTARPLGSPGQPHEGALGPERLVASPGQVWRGQLLAALQLAQVRPAVVHQGASAAWDKPHCTRSWRNSAPNKPGSVDFSVVNGHPLEPASHNSQD